MVFASTHRSRSRLWWCAALLALATATSADVVINEFMASNGTTQTNALGETSDWIELYNAGDTTVDLAGWHLTDRRDNLTKWTFPHTNLPPASYLLVEASGRATPIVGAELHADIKLDAEGEYLGLVKPDGLTIVSEFAPQFPAQTTDVSFGLRPDTETIPLLTGNEVCRYQVPVDGADGTNWTTVAFNDSGWAQGPLGIGYESAPADFAALIQTTLPTLTAGAYIRCRFVVANPALLDALMLRVKFDDGFVAYLNGSRIASANDPVAVSWSSMATVEQSNDQATVFQDYDVSAARAALVAGTNVISFHLLNRTINPRVPNDLLLVPELSALSFTPSPSADWRYFHEPTPGSRNLLGTLDTVQPVAFSEDHGFRSAPFSLALSNATAGAAIYYTTDSSVPTTNTATRYTAPIPVTRTTVVRARAFKANQEPSAVNTRTYLFAADIIASPSMRTTITQDPVYGPQMTNALLAIPTLSVATTTTGIDYSPELPASLELIWPNGREGFQINAGITRFGNYWQNFEKRMFRLYFRQQYGAGKLRYPLFDGFERGIEPVQEFDQLDLKSGSQDMARYGFYMAESFCDDAILEMGHLNPHGFFVHVYLNGQYWGIYHLHERWKANTLASYIGGEPEDYQADDSEGTSENWQDEPVHPVDGDGSVWTRLTAQRSNYEVQRAYLDVPQFLDFMLLWFMGGCEGEFRGVGPIAANAGGYKMWMKDTDGWMRGIYHPLTNPGPGALMSGLRQEAHPDYLMLERDHIHKNFFGDGPLTPARNRARLIRRCDELEPAFPAESARWGYRTPDTWATEKAAALVRFDSLTDLMLGNLRAAGWYPQDAPSFTPAGGLFTGTITVAISVTNGVPIYYTLNGEDPREAGSGAAVGSLYASPLTLTRTTTIKARARNGTTWGALQEALYIPALDSPLRLTELMHHPRLPTAAETNAPGGAAWSATDFEYVELRNTGPDTIGLAGVRFTDGIQFDFSAGTVPTLAPGAYVLVVKNRAAFSTRYPAVPATTIAGEFAAIDNWPVQTLNDGGERLRLVDGLNRTIVSFTYGNDRRWPLAAAGAGHSLIPLMLDDQSDALEFGGNWRASALRDGSPGATDPTPIRDVLVNEIVAHTDYTNAALPEYDSNDWIELLNVTAATIGLDHWYLSDRADALTLWRIPATNLIAAGGLLTFDEVHDFHHPITNGFGLNKAGDQVFLSFLPGDSRDRVADAVRFDGQENGWALGRSPDGGPDWHALPPTPAAANPEPPAHVIISEFMFHPPDTNGAADTTTEFIEIYNSLGTTAALWNVDGPWRLRGDADWDFIPGTQLAPGERLVLVPFDPTSNPSAHSAFLTAYGLTNGQVRLLGPFAGPLSDRGARIALLQPLAPDIPGDPLVWVTMDELTYFDRQPWPTGADASGWALTRVSTTHSANDPANWYATAPTPGRPPDRVALTAPAAESVVFDPGPIIIYATVDAPALTPPVAALSFFAGDQLLGTRASEPYALPWSIPAPGRFALRAELTDAAGSWTSRVIQVDAMSVSTVSVASVTDREALLHGQLAGERAAEIRVYWGEADGGTEPTAWEQSALVGTISNAPFALHVTDLPPNRTFHIRASARVGSTLGWSPASTTFTTPGYEQWPFTTRIRIGGYTESETLLNFPVLILLGPHLPGFDYAQFGTGWTSLRFTDDAGLRRLRYDVDTWNTNGTSAVWVQIPTLTTGTTIRAYWGLDGLTNPPAEAQPDGVWAGSYEAVWHLGDTLDNAAQPDRPATNDGALPASGIVGTAHAFDGIRAAIDPMLSPAWYSDHLSAQTWSLWVRPSPTVAFGATPFGADGTTNRLYLAMNTSARILKWIHGAGTTELQGALYALDTWQMLSMVLSNGTLYAQLNDGPLAALGACPSFTVTNQPLIGRRGNGANAFAGSIDEVRLAPTSRSGAWLRSEYRTIAAPLSFAIADPVRQPNALDADDDGLPDDWERMHLGGTALSGGDDSDGDGMTDAGEYTTGTNPQDRDSVFRLDLQLTPPAPAVAIPMRAAQGTGYTDRVRYYDLLTAPTLDLNAWAPVANFTNILGEDLLLIHTNPGTPAGNRYYRTRVRLEATP